MSSQKTNEMNVNKQPPTAPKPTIYARAKNIALRRRIHQNQNSGFWLVESETNKGFYCVRYISDEKRYVCDCPHFTYGGVVACKHILACLFRMQAKSMLNEEFDP